MAPDNPISQLQEKLRIAENEIASLIEDRNTLRKTEKRLTDLTNDLSKEIEKMEYALNLVLEKVMERG